MSSMNEKKSAGCGECKCGETVAKAIEECPSGWSELLFRATVADLLHVLTPYLQIRLPMPEADHDIACRAIDKLSFMLESDVTPPADADRAEALTDAEIKRICCEWRGMAKDGPFGDFVARTVETLVTVRMLRRLAAAPAVPATHTTFALGDSVRKTKGSQWHGKVVGWYSTTLTPEGYAVESATERGSVQIYPAAALERDAAHEVPEHKPHKPGDWIERSGDDEPPQIDPAATVEWVNRAGIDGRCLAGSLNWGGPRGQYPVLRYRVVSAPAAAPAPEGGAA